MANRDKASNQMQEWKDAQKGTTQITTSAGAPIGDKNNLQTIGPRGPAPIGDFPFEDEISHFGRERIPERVVHSKGAGAHGFFEVTHDITKYSKAKIFEHIGKKTPLFLRFSTVGGEKGSADTARDPRGFACKFYTEDGNWDLVGNNTPIFFIRDAMLFPSFIHTQKRNPRTNLKDADMFWDFITLRPECCHQTAFHFSNRGTPDGFRFMNGYGSHTYKLINKDEEAVYVKFHMKTVQGIKNLSGPRADHLAGADPDYATRDLYNAIANGDYPSWIFNIQVMTYAEAEKHQFNPFDMTKVWPQGEFPLIPVGKMTLNRNPKNYFAETEQSAFAPAHLVPGIEPSPDKMLQGRLFSYSDDHRHRLGTNYLQIPINRPLNAKVHNYQRDGPQCIDDNQGDAPNYFPNSFSGPTDNKKFVEHREPIHGDISRYNTADDDNFTQTGNFWRNVLSPSERKDLISNMSSHLVNAQEFIQKRAIRNFTQCDPDFGRQLGEAVDRIMAGSGKSGANL